jgi:hypothetical protein
VTHELPRHRSGQDTRAAELVQRLEAERLHPSPPEHNRSKAQRDLLDLRELIVILAAMMLGPHWRPGDPA